MQKRTLAPVLHYLRQIDTDARVRRDTDADLLEQFVRGGNETAFATILKRYGPMVFGVCRRVLRDRHEAEDAFQATFLLLVRKAASLRQPERLGNWLYGVAYRAALKARSIACRRARADGHGNHVAAPPADDAMWRDLRPVLDDAINDLPARYRIPFVLCYLQGLTNLQAAQRLGCPEGTVATWLSRARQRLRNRLAKHGPGVGAALAALCVASNPSSAALPALLLVSTLRIAAAFRAGDSAAVPASVATLTKGVGNAMFMTKLGWVLATFALIGAAIGGTAIWAPGAPGEGQVTPPAQALQAPPPLVETPLVTTPPMPRDGPAPATDPVAEKENTPAVLRTDNFIVHAPSRRIAQLVGEAAERLRKSEAILWLGKELPSWPELCTLKVTGGGNGTGHYTTLQFDAAKVLHRDMLLDGTLDQVLCNGLPHEITHTVLADYCRAPVPRWADEGAAMLAVEADEQQRHQALMRGLIDQPDRLIPLTRLWPMQDYPKDVMAFYAQAHSLTRFLIERKDRKTFLAFVKQGMHGAAWDTAVKAHYGFDDVAAVQEAWLAQVKKDPKTQPLPAVAAGKGPVITSVPPIIGRASISKDGRVVVRKPVSYYKARTDYVKAGSGVAAVPVTVYELAITEQVVNYDQADVAATDIAGKPIDPKTLTKRLQTETAVLIAAMGKEVDPYYLTVVRAGTIILVLRDTGPPMVQPSAAPQAAPAPLLPQSISR